MALGILPDASFNAQSHTVSLSDISKLLLYSDGLLEAWNEKEQMFGQQRLRQAFLECTDSPAPLEFIYSQVERFVCGHAFEDDITMTYIDTHALPGYA